MFVDKVKVKIQAGKGGNGYLSFRQEKFIDMGGPDGGDGGDGGDVILVASNNQNTLATFRYQKELKAADGKPGFSSKKHGRSGEDLIVAVPVGTIAMLEDGTVLADLTHDQDQVVIAKGGKGGFGNAHFVSSTRQAPKVAEKGEDGDVYAATLELKMIADVGLVGLPNAGKSTLLSVISNARPEIADYPFTTIRPNLGVVDIDEGTSLLVADIPGLIAGAAEGKGLGDEFLRHVERTKVLVHLVDAYNEDVTWAYKTVLDELKAYSKDLSSRPHIAILTKIEGLDDDIVQDQLTKLKKAAGAKVPVFAISAKSKAGVKELLFKLKDMVNKIKKVEAEQMAHEKPVLTLPEDLAWRVQKLDKGFSVTGRKIEKFAARTDFESWHAVQRLRDIMRKMGIMQELERQGIETDQPIKIGKSYTLTY